MNLNFEDTICAISTPPGTGGIAVVRVSGSRAIEVVDSIWRGRRLAQAASHTAHLGTVVDGEGRDLDQAVATVYRGPASYTGEDVVEISVHGSRWIQRELLDALCGAGCRLAEHGEFSRRAFAAGKLDLAQAEAVADMIAADSRAAHRIAISQMRGDYSRRLNDLRERLVALASLLELELDFSEEDVEFASRAHLKDLAEELYAELTRLTASFRAGQAIRQGIPVAIIGEPNAGKSSLLNALLGDDRAIVSEIPGTTRDIVEDTLELGDYLFRFMDTAGLRHSDDTIEAMGIERSRRTAANARIVVAVVDATQPPAATPEWLAELPEGTDLVIALNKSDLPGAVRTMPATQGTTQISISARTGEGLDALRSTLQSIAGADTAQADATVTNARHAQALAQAAEATRRVIQGLAEDLPGDLVAQDIRQTIHHLSEITGQITTADLLQNIFSKFCIGK